MIVVKPKGHARVRLLDGALLAAAGATVPDQPYWRRREADGDVSIEPARRQTSATTRSKA